MSSEFKKLTEDEMFNAGTGVLCMALEAAYAWIDELQNRVKLCNENPYSYIHCEEHKRLEATVKRLQEALSELDDAIRCHKYRKYDKCGIEDPSLKTDEYDFKLYNRWEKYRSVALEEGGGK